MRLATLLSFIVIACAATPATAEELYSPEFGLSVTLPPGTAACPQDPSAPLHGWRVALGGDCSNPARRLGINAEFNAVFFKSLSDAAGCEDLAGMAFTAEQEAGLSFPKLRSVSCAAREIGGGISVRVAAQAWRWPHTDPDDSVEFHQTQMVNYYAYLWTTDEALEEDLATLKALLRTVKLRRPAQ